MFELVQHTMSLSSHAGAYYMGGGSGGWWHGTDYSSWDSAQSWMPSESRSHVF